MKILDKNKDHVTIQLEKSDLFNMADVFLYAVNQYSHLDHALLNVSREDIRAMHSKLRAVMNDM